MKLKLFTLLAALCLSVPAVAQNAASGSLRVQGAPDGYGDPVQVTIVGANGSDVSTTSVVTGNIAHDAVDSGAPVKVGCKVDSGPSGNPVASGDRSDIECDIYGAQYVNIVNGGFALGGSTPADATGNAAGFLATRPMNLAFNGTTWDRMRGDTNAVAVQPALTANFWSYAAAASGIVSSTADVAVKTAAGASVRNYLCSIQISHDTLSAVSEIVAKDGATVIWRGRLQTTATDSSGGAGTISFSPCLRGTANTALNVAMISSVTGGVYVSAQGFTGS